jgi:peptidoglycan/LPS O-acetylase OafA/YrhL
MAANRRHRSWRSPIGVAANALIALLLLLAAVVFISDHRWIAAAFDLAVVVVFGAVPAVRAYRDGALLKREQPTSPR